MLAELSMISSSLKKPFLALAYEKCIPLRAGNSLFKIGK
jgi:hypothetical protein